MQCWHLYKARSNKTKKNLNHSGSCAGHCGGASFDCYCDDTCSAKGDCCHDYTSQCHVTTGSCHGKCGHVVKSGCQCDLQCKNIGDCCADYSTICLNHHNHNHQLINNDQSCKDKCSDKKILRFNRKLKPNSCYCDQGCDLDIESIFTIWPFGARLSILPFIRPFVLAILYFNLMT